MVLPYMVLVCIGSNLFLTEIAHLKVFWELTRVWTHKLLLACHWFYSEVILVLHQLLRFKIFVLTLIVGSLIEVILIL